MIDFPTLYPSLVKYLPNWSERFYPSLAQFARGEGYPCGNQGVFIPRRNKCWTHPKTGQRLKKPLTYQMYKDAKEKSQRSRTEKGRTALETREQGFRDKAREKVKGWQNKTPEPEVALKVGTKQVNIKGSPELYKELNLTHDPSLGWQVTNKNGDVLRQPKDGNLQPTHRFKEKSQAENFAKQVMAKVNRMTGKPATKSEPKQTPNSTGVKGTGGKTFDLDNLWRQTADAAYSKNKDGVSKNLEQWRQVVKKLESGEGISKDVNLNEYEKLMDNLEKKLVLDPKDPSNVEFKKITGSIYRTLDKAIRRDPLTQEDLEKAHPNFRPIMQRMNKTFTKHNELGDKKRLLEKELDRLKNERSYNESVILNNSKQFRETSIDNNYNELKALVKRNPNDLIDIKNPVSNLPERTVSVSKRIDEINKDIRDLADDGKAQIIQEQAKKEIARLQTPIKDTENRVSSLANEIKSLRESRGEATKSETKQTPNSTGVKGTGGKSETKIGKWNNKNFSPDDYIKEKDDLADGWFREGDKGAKEKYDQWVQNSMKKKVKLTVPGDVVATPDFMNMQRSGMINKNEIETKIRAGKELETLRTTYTFPSSFSHALQLYESQKPGVRKKIKFEFDGDLPDVPSRKKDFNASLKLANFAKPGCCCEASKPLRRRKTKQTPRLKRRGNRYA